MNNDWTSKIDDIQGTVKTGTNQLQLKNALKIGPAINGPYASNPKDKNKSIETQDWTSNNMDDIKGMIKTRTKEPQPKNNLNI